MLTNEVGGLYGRLLHSVAFYLEANGLDVVADRDGDRVDLIGCNWASPLRVVLVFCARDLMLELFQVAQAKREWAQHTFVAGWAGQLPGAELAAAQMQVGLLRVHHPSCNVEVAVAAAAPRRLSA